MINRAFLFIIVYFYFIPVSALQSNVKTDSLLKKAKEAYLQSPTKGLLMAKQVYKTAQANNNPILAVQSLILSAKFYISMRSYDSATIYGKYGLQAAEKYPIDSLKGNAWMVLGLVDHSLGNYQQAIEKYNKSLLFYTKANNFSIAFTYLNIGICKQQISQYEDGIRYCLLASKIFEDLKDNKDLADTYRSIALSFVSLGNYPKAIEYNKKALIIRQKLNDNQLISQSLNNIGLAYKEYHQPDSAILYLTKCLAMRKQGKDTSILILPLQNLGSACKMKGDFKKAESYILRSLRIAANYGMKEELARGNLDLAELYTAQKQYAPALVAASSAQNTAEKLKLPELLMSAYTDKFTIYTQQGDYKNALLYNNRSNTIKDSLFTIAKNKTINELEIQYQTAQKEKDIAALNLQNQLQKKIVGQQKLSIIVLVIASFLLLLLFGIAYNNFKIKNKANRRIQTLMQDMHHRVKNNLQILAGLFSLQIESQTDENAKNALRENEARLISMNLIHNQLYQDNTTTQIEMQDYLGKLLHHIKNAFNGNNIQLQVEIEPLMLDADKAVAIGLIVNELATNAFKYAFDGKYGEIYLGVKLYGKSKILLTLKDNGKGITQSDKDPASSSFGLKLINLMVRQLKATLQVNYDNGLVYQIAIDV